MHDFVALDPSHLRGGSKLTEADGAGNPSRLAKQPRSGLAFTGWRRPNALRVRVQEGFPAPLPRGERGVGSAHGVGKTLGGRAQGEKRAVGTHFKGFVYKAQSQLCSLAWLSGDMVGGRMSPVSLKAAPMRPAPLSLG